MIPALLLAFSLPAAAELSPVRACLKWSKEAPEAEAAGAKAFASFTLVKGAGPHHGCEVVASVDDFGVGWLMRAWMKVAVHSPCGKELGRFKIGYKGDAWQEKLVAELSEWLAKNPAAPAAAKECPPAPVVVAPPVPELPAGPIDVSTTPKNEPLREAPLLPPTTTYPALPEPEQLQPVPHQPMFKGDGN